MEKATITVAFVFCPLAGGLIYFQCSNLDGVIWQVFAKCLTGSFILGGLVCTVRSGRRDTIDGMLRKRCSKSRALVGFAVFGLAAAGVAVGAMAIGALAIGALGIGNLRMGTGQMRS